MTPTLLALVAAVLVIGIALSAWRWADRTADKAAWARLASRQPEAPAAFAPALIAELPEPARRLFRFAIAPGTPLYTVAEIDMAGEFSLGNKADPKYLSMSARQILAAPHGFIWAVRAGNLMRISGSDGASDGASWSRFWLAGLAPVARAGHNPDHARSAFGRYVAEAVFWTPAALLPGEGIRWEAIDSATARVTVTHGGMEQAVDIAIDADGRPNKVKFQRWSDANPEKQFQLQPFGGYLSNHQTFGGFRLPTTIEAGNFFETDDYFAFFKATVTAVRFPTSGDT